MTEETPRFWLRPQLSLLSEPFVALLGAGSKGLHMQAPFSIKGDPEFILPHKQPFWESEEPSAAYELHGILRSPALSPALPCVACC